MLTVIDMTGDYEALPSEAKTAGAYDAFRRYEGHYAGLFGGMFKYLYMAEPDEMRPVIEAADFSRLLATARTNIENGYHRLIPRLADEAAYRLGFSRRFDLYLGLSLGNVGGYSGPPQGGTPFIYIGLDMPLTPELIHTLVPHEVNHMARLSALPGLDMFDFTERTVSEGLASACPLVLNSWGFTPRTCALAMGIQADRALELIRNARPLMRRVADEFGRPLTRELMNTYFTWSARGNRLGGYYAGIAIIRKLLDMGYRLAELTAMPSQKILSLYRE